MLVLSGWVVSEFKSSVMKQESAHKHLHIYTKEIDWIFVGLQENDVFEERMSVTAVNARDTNFVFKLHNIIMWGWDYECT